MDYNFFPEWETHLTENNETFIFPEEMKFNDAHAVTIVFYSILMMISATGNICVLIILLRNKGTYRSRINIMLIHLAIADLLVTFLLMPIEIMWAATVNWRAGNTACKIAAFFRTFGLYQSSFVLVSIGIDRYYAVLKPLRLRDADRRGKIILSCSWIVSVLCSAPQMMIFRVERHPNVSWYEQCLTINSFPSWAHEMSYSLFSMIMMYLFPLIVITYCYGSIFKEICHRSKDLLTNSDKLRRSNLGFLEKAKVRTLKMTITIVMAFFICWTPYYVMTFWYWVDQDSAMSIDRRVQKALYLFACTNSSINPIVYGVFNIRKKTRVGGPKRGSNNTCMTEIRLPQLPQIIGNQ